MNARARALVGLGVSILAVGVLLWEINLGRVLDALGHSQVHLLPLALVPFGVDLICRTIRWRVLLARQPRPGYRGTFGYLVIGYLANNVLPARLGEFVRAHLLGTREGVGRSRALGSIAMERALDVVVAAALGAVASSMVGLQGAIEATLALIALAGGAVVALVVFIPHATVRRWLDAVAARAPAGLPARAAGIASRFFHALLDAAEPWRVLVALALSLTAWIATAAIFAVTAASLHIAFPAAGLVAVAVVANLGTALPSAPAGIGPFEFGVVVIATALGLDAPTALAFGILSHAATVLPVSLLGGFELGRIRWGLGSLREAGEAEAVLDLGAGQTDIEGAEPA